jgi:hypothetical protein
MFDLYEHIADPVYIAKRETFESWYENPLDLPGRWYLEAIRQLFTENRFAKGEFVGLGRRLSLRSVICPVYLLAGADDDITPKEQVFEAEHHPEHRGRGSSRGWLPAATSAFSWEPGPLRRHGRRSRGG